MFQLTSHVFHEILPLCIFFFFWHCSPWCTLNSSKIVLQYSRCCDSGLPIVLPLFFGSSSTNSSHLNLGSFTRRMRSVLKRVDNSFVQYSILCNLTINVTACYQRRAVVFLPVPVKSCNTVAVTSSYTCAVMLGV